MITQSHDRSKSYIHPRTSSKLTVMNNNGDISPSSTPLPLEELKAWIREKNVRIFGEKIPFPILSYDNLVAPEELFRSFIDLGYQKPTVIQSLAWPILLNGRNFVGISQTGSGKTLAYMVPAILHILSKPRLALGEGPKVLVIAPTRELVFQIEEEGRKLLARFSKLRIMSIYGGVPKLQHIQLTKAGAHICVATPGRLLELLNMHVINLLSTSMFVLDEADRMLEMGFKDSIDEILLQMPDKYQMAMFSATWPQDIQDLSVSYLRYFIRVCIGSNFVTANSNIVQKFILVKKSKKVKTLIELLNQLQNKQILIFAETTHSVDRLYNKINSSVDRKILTLHGKKSQVQRNETLINFKNDSSAILIATDIAARGLDITCLNVVINFNFPANIEIYVHRIGRTGRSKNKGQAFSLITKHLPLSLVEQLIEFLGNSNQPIPEELALLNSTLKHDVPRMEHCRKRLISTSEKPRKRFLHEK